MSTPNKDWVRCVSCGGVFDRAQPGGYYHKCPPYKMVADEKHGLDPNGKPLSGPVALEDRRNENIDDSVPDKPVIKAKGKGLLKTSKPPPDKEV